MKHNIFISTVAFNQQPVEEIIKQVIAENFNIEFSSGLPFNPALEEIFISTPVKRLPHNYFPAPAVPFVLNLASTNEDIRRQSIQMCTHGLWLAKQAGSLFYAAHAGFCIDPDPQQLGKQLSVNVVLDKKHHWQIFIESVKEIMQNAAALGMLFLIENNVIAKFNLTDSFENPLFCCDADELINLNQEINNELFGILLDTAHLKVSAQTLNLDPATELKKLIPFIKALHHSDNDGYKDTNEKLDNNYWCANLLGALKDLPHVIEVKNIAVEEIKAQEQLLTKFLTHESYY